MERERQEMEKDEQWGVESLYASPEAWEGDFQKMSWENLGTYKGNLSQRLKDFLDAYFDVKRRLMTLYTYAHLRHDEDVANEKHKNAYDRITTQLHAFESDTAWITPEILQLDALVGEELEPYRIYLEKVSRLRPYTLGADKEELLALASRALETPDRAFGMLSNADLSFAPVEDSKGEKRRLTQGSYGLFLQSDDRTLRKNAFDELHRGFGSFENTLSELIAGQVHSHYFDARVRGYRSCLEAALFPHHIDPIVYDTLVSTVRKNLSPLHDYVALRKKRLNLDEIHFYDLYCPLVADVERTYTYDEAKHLVIDAAAPLGEEYQAILSKGLNEERWVDPYENKRKRSGAYSSGCYDSHPFILMNFHGTARDVSTLMHEAGHSMHTYYSNRSQPYHYARYPIFLAEIASTFNEELLFRHMLAQATSKEEEEALISQRLDDIRGTLYRQTMFAEFEKRLHEYGEKGMPLTPTTLKREYRELNAAYYGPALTLDEGLDVEFLRVPHFYYNFYVYQYATGLSAAFALAERVLEGGKAERDQYLAFLSSGSSKPPLELLKEAGVDLTRGAATEHLIAHFAALSKKLEA